MTIEIHQPELEALIQQRLDSGEFENVEALLLDALSSTGRDSAHAPTTESPASNSWAQFIEASRGLGEGVDGADSFARLIAKGRGLADDLDISRDPSPGRPIDL